MATHSTSLIPIFSFRKEVITIGELLASRGVQHSWNHRSSWAIADISQKVCSCRFLKWYTETYTIWGSVSRLRKVKTKKIVQIAYLWKRGVALMFQEDSVVILIEKLLRSRITLFVFHFRYWTTFSLAQGWYYMTFCTGRIRWHKVFDKYYDFWVSLSILQCFTSLATIADFKSTFKKLLNLSPQCVLVCSWIALCEMEDQ